LEKLGTIGVIAGGDSPERAVSLVSGKQVHVALKQLGAQARIVQINNLDDLVPGLRGIGIVFNCLHGGSGEDGTVQLLFEVLGIPYAGSGPLASALSMDKPRSKTVLAAKGVVVPRGQVYQKGSLEEFLETACDTLGLPLVLKPWDQGSSVGVQIIDKDSELVAAASATLSQFGSLFVEEYIRGRELTAGILLINGEERALPLVEMRPKNRYFDYEAKYTKGMTEFLVPAPLPAKTTQQVQKVALAAHRILGCRGFSRVDLRLGEDDIPYVLEVNTLPGMTPTSDLPQAAAADGIEFPQLVKAMLQTAYKEVES